MKKFIKGMVKDPERVDQPESTFRDALNANMYLQKGAIANELGNKLVANISPAIVNHIGQVALEDGRIVLFCIDTVGHVISILNPKSQEYTVLYRNNALNFQPDHTIEATAKVNTQGDVLVYFTDNYLVRLTDSATGIGYIDDFNPPRVFNVSKQLQNLSSGVTVLYGNAEYNIDKLDLFLHSGEIPQFNEVQIEDGGGVVSGTYHLALAYVDEDGNNTNYLVTSNAVHLVTTPEDTIPTETITGDPQGSQSKKSITWEVTIPATVNYSHIKPVVIQRFGGQNQESSEFAYQLKDVKIPEATGFVREMTITYTGLETVASEDVSAVVIDHVRYETAKTLVQLNNQLYISNLKSRGDIGFQRFANNITLNAVKQKVERFDPRYFDVISLNYGYNFLKSEASEIDYTLVDRLEEYKNVQSIWNFETPGQGSRFNSQVRKGYKDSKLFYKNKSYRRSEVYAFYISFVLKDGTETYAYHIPGRDALEIADGITERSNLSQLPTANISSSVFDVEEMYNKYDDAKLYQVTDTQVLLSQVSGVEVSTNFWENVNEKYPQSPDFGVWETDEDGNAVQVSSLQNLNVRHHKMPSNKHQDWKFIGDNDGWNSTLNFDPPISNIDESGEEKTTMFEDINILGIKLSNIKIPKFILRQVQGYKIYYAKRDQANKTIIGQSIPVPAAFRGVTSPTMDLDIAVKSKFSKAWWMYGGIPENLTAYLNVQKGEKEYRAINVFGFHDFNLLKNMHTLSGASHIDVQSVLVMKHYRGGPNIRVNTQNSLNDFNVPDWVSSEVQNITDPDYTGDVTGVPPALRVKAFRTSIMLAHGYYNPSSLNNSRFNLTNNERGGLSDTNSIYALNPKSITYLPGHIHLETTIGTEYGGVQYLYNFGGESEIAVGLASGLPMLKGWSANSASLVETVADNDVWETYRFSWYPNGGYLNSNFLNNPLSANYGLAQGNSVVVNGNGGWPATYLVNLCALKSDVYASFDEQKLVWTGHYQSLSDVDPDTGYTAKQDKNYYLGATSEDVFGGDTYIGRYSFRSTSLSYGHSTYPWSDIPLDEQTSSTAGVQVYNESFYTLEAISAITGLPSDVVEDEYLDNKLWSIPEAWRKGNNTPNSTVFYFMCESDDLLGFRHQGDQSQGVDVKHGAYFDASTAHEAVFAGPTVDKTHMDNLLYMNNYSLNQDIRVALPYPKKLNDVTAFPTRTIRSLDDEGSINDKYRFYQALEFKDLPRNRGDIFKLFTLGSILYLHAERSLFVTRGKQQLQLGDNTQAYVGSGNIFEIDPDEVIPTNEGYGGCDSQFTGLTTRFGQFYFNRKDKKAYLYSESIIEVSSLGMEKWFLENTPYQLEQLGLDLEELGFEVDSPTSDFGFMATYDPRFKRIILTKREKIPTNQFTVLYTQGVIAVRGSSFIDLRTGNSIEFSDTQYFTDGGWTLSFYPELQAWVSRHSYIPRLYTNTAENYYSLVNASDSSVTQVWEHSDYTNPCSFFDEVFSFEFEYIDNTAAGASKVFSSIYYWADVMSVNPINYQQTYKQTSTGFTGFYVYNTTQISGVLTPINYLSNSRLVDRVWYINDFRDMAATQSITTDELVTGVPNVQGDFTTGVTNNLNNISMFVTEGVVNPNYINENKSWFEQRRFIDHYLGVRLINDNSNNNLVYLYAAGTKHRQSFR
jgi:hypothetical protein